MGFGYERRRGRALREAARATTTWRKPRPRRRARRTPFQAPRLLDAGAGRLGADLRGRASWPCSPPTCPTPRSSTTSSASPRSPTSTAPGRVVAVRGSQYSPPVDLDQLPPYVPAAFVAIEDRQFYHHFGFNPWGMVARRGLQPHPPRRAAAGRLDHHPAAGPQPLPHPRPDLSAARRRSWSWRCGWRRSSPRSRSSRST